MNRSLVLGLATSVVAFAFAACSSSSGSSGNGGGSDSGSDVSSSGSGSGSGSSSGSTSSSSGSSSGSASSSGGSSSSGSSSGGSSGSSSGGDGGAAPSCTDYCNLMNANCTGNNQQFVTGACAPICATYTPGMTGAASGDTLGCREYHANLAAADPTTHCPHASMLGGMVCAVDNCTSFCEADLALCTGANAAYTSMAACKTACAAYTYNTGEAITADTNKNTLNCRVYHLQLASTGGANLTTHCPHTAQTSAVCTM